MATQYQATQFRKIHSRSNRVRPTASSQPFFRPGEDQDRFRTFLKSRRLVQKQNETDGSPIELGNNTGKANEHLSEQMIDQPQVQPVPRQDAPVARVSAVAPAPQAVSTSSASTSTQPAISDEVPKNTPTPPVVDLETMPCSSTGGSDYTARMIQPLRPTRNPRKRVQLQNEAGKCSPTPAMLSGFEINVVAIDRRSASSSN